MNPAVMNPAVMSPECLSFRAGFEPGGQDAHRAACVPCARYAETIELAARASRSLPLPAGLGERLRHIAPRAGEPMEAEEAPAPPRAPELPLPAHLAARLREIPRLAPSQIPGARPAGRRAAPAPVSAWILRPAASVAASLLLTVLVTWLVGNPVARVEPWARTVSLRASLALEDQANRGKVLVRRLVEPALETAGDETGIPSPKSFPAELRRLLGASPSEAPTAAGTR